MKRVKSSHALTEKFPHIIQPKKQDICYATQNRQDAVKVMIPLVDMMVVVGSANSSNSNRLKELAAKLGVDSYLVDHPNQLSKDWFVDKKRIGITAGASAPEALTQLIIQQIKSYGSNIVRTLPGIEERVNFPMPKGLAR
jgi:4-hydroxy-3-methylbut-2-enyl diphosphate reductase